MKVKSLAMLAASGLMAVSLAYVMPAFAEEFDDVDAGPMQLALGDDSTPRTPDASANNNENATENANSANAASANNNNAAAGGAANTNSEQGTPDVASGDDDY